MGLGRMGSAMLPVVMVVAGCQPSDSLTVPEPAVAEGTPSGEPSVRAAPSTPQPAAPAGATKRFEFEAAQVSDRSPGSCAFPGIGSADTFKLFAAGAYAGRKLGIQIDESGNEATQIDIAVNQTDKPVALMLGAYDPTVWNVGWAEGTRVVAVLVSGYHRQIVTGLPAHVPLINSTYDNKGACGYYYVTPEKAGTLNPVARRVFGRGIDMIFPAKDGRAVVGEPLAADVRLVTDVTAKPADAFKIAEERAAGEAGLSYAMRQGWLRKATQADADAWLAAVNAQPQADVPPIAGGHPPGRVFMHNGYVVLKPFELPKGLYGAHSATFFVPSGVQRPSGNPGHSTMYDFNTLACNGPGCGHE